MTKAAKLALVAVVLVIVAGSVGFYWFVLRDTAPPDASLDALGSDDGDTGDAPETPDGTWAVDSETDAEFFAGYIVKEVFGGDTIEKVAKGRTTDVTGTIVISGTKATEAQFTVDLRTLESGEDQRDGIVQNDLLRTAEFPEATFTLTEPIDFDKVPELATPVKVTAKGDLTVHGVTKPVEVTLEARWNGNSIDLIGSAPLVFADFDIEAPNTAFVDVKEEGELEFQLRFRLTDGAAAQPEAGSATTTAVAPDSAGGSTGTSYAGEGVYPP